MSRGHCGRPTNDSCSNTGKEGTEEVRKSRMEPIGMDLLCQASSACYHRVTNHNRMSAGPNQE